MDNNAARDQKVAAAKKKLKQYKKKKAVGSVESTSTTHKNSSESVALTDGRRNSIASDSGSVRTDETGQETIAVAEEDNISATNTNSDIVENQASQGYSDYIPQSSAATSLSLVEGLQPIFQPHGQQSQPSLLSKQIDLTIAESILPSAANSAEEPHTYESLSNLYNKQQQDIGLQRQAIAMLVDEKNALASELEKYSAMADRFKSSEELLEEGQLLVDALRRKNAELEEKIRNGEDQLKEAGEQKEKILESLQLQNTCVEQLEKDNKQLISQVNTKDSIIEQLTQEKVNDRSVSDEVEALRKTLQDKEDKYEDLEIELSSLRHKLANAEQQLSGNTEKISEAEQVSRETHAKLELMTKEIQQLTNERNELTHKIEEISSSLKTKEVEASDLSEQVSSNSSVIEKLNSERVKFLEELQNAQSENSKLTKRIKDLTTKNEGLSSDNRDLIAQLTELREKCVEINNDKSRLVEEVDREKSRAARLEQELLNVKTENKTTNGTTREIVHEENQNHQPIVSKATPISPTSQEELKQQLFRERQKTLNLELQLKRILEASPSLTSSNLNLSPPNSASRRYSFSQFSGDFEIGKCSGCIGEVIIV